MKARTRFRSASAVTLAALLACFFAPAAAWAVEQSCLTCHLTEAMLVKNRGVVMPTVSAMQSGAG
jgi:hypothetical protein